MLKKPEKKQINKQSIAILSTMALVLVALVSVFMFSPGLVTKTPPPEGNKKVNIPTITGSIGPREDVGRKRRRIEPPKTTQVFEDPFGNQPDFNDLFKDRIPTTIPTIPSQPPFEEPKKPEDFSLEVYAKHADITDRMKEGLSPSFKLETFTEAPKGRGKSRFNTAYVISDDGESLERFDLMTLVRNDSMRAISTAKDALKALVEESEAVNVIESEDKSLIYDLSGTRGYQIGKIIVDEHGIYILGYVNLTTNRMPSILKKQWIEKLEKI